MNNRVFLLLDLNLQVGRICHRIFSPSQNVVTIKRIHLQHPSGDQSQYSTHKTKERTGDRGMTVWNGH